MSMGLTMTPGYPRPPRPMRRYGRGVRAATIAGLLADPTRLKVVAALVLGAGTLEEVAEATGLPLRDVALAARRLGRAGLVRRDRHELELLTDRFGAAARAAAEAIVVWPSHPSVSVGPILAVPGLRDRLASAPVPRVAVSPIVAGQALKGPAAHMLTTLGHEVSPVGVARLYVGLIDGMVIDAADAAARNRIEALGLRVLVTQTVMGERADRERLAGEVLDFCRALAAAGAR